LNVNETLRRIHEKEYYFFYSGFEETSQPEVPSLSWQAARRVRNSLPAGDRARSRGRIVLFAAGIALILVAYYALTWRSFVNTINAFEELFSDFVIYYYPMGEAIFRMGLPVEGFLYSPFIAILLAVFPPLV
jgi:hypothetical protein